MNNAFKVSWRPGRFVLSLLGALVLVSALFIYQLSATAEVSETNAGCIKPSPELVDSTFGPQSRDIFFDYESDSIREDAKDVLSENADILKNNPDTFVIIQGQWAINETGGKVLAESRAHNVRDFIISQGVEAGRILTSSDCNLDELTVSSTQEQRELNRKVHFVTVEPKGQGFASIIEYVDNNVEG